MSEPSLQSRNGLEYLGFIQLMFYFKQISCSWVYFVVDTLTVSIISLLVLFRLYAFSFFFLFFLAEIFDVNVVNARSISYVCINMFLRSSLYFQSAEFKHKHADLYLFLFLSKRLSSHLVCSLTKLLSGHCALSYELEKIMQLMKVQYFSDCWLIYVIQKVSSQMCICITFSVIHFSGMMQIRQKLLINP